MAPARGCNGIAAASAGGVPRLEEVALDGRVLAFALASCWIPARRASRVDPMVALREQ